jgi:hypothetical protein
MADRQWEVDLRFVQVYKPSWNFGLAGLNGQPLLIIKKEETTPGYPATMSRGPGTAPHQALFYTWHCNTPGTAPHLQQSTFPSFILPSQLHRHQAEPVAHIAVHHSYTGDLFFC